MQFLALQDAILASLTSNASLADVMYALCREVERMVPDIVATTLRLDDGNCIRPVACPGMPSIYDESLDGIAIGPTVGTCGVAMTYGRPHLTPAIEEDPNWPEPFKALMRQLGLVTCWSHPIKRRDGRVLGSLAFYYRRRHEPDDLDRQLAEICLRLCRLAFEHDDMQQSIRRLAYHDTLTGLPNRTMIEAEIARHIAEASRGGARFSLLLVDVDGFKSVNDDRGHQVGDGVLRWMAQQLQDSVREMDFVGRLGGDEFLAIIRHETAGQVGVAAERIQHALGASFHVQGNPAVRVRLGASIGVATWPDDGGDSQALLERAGGAMREARRAGRNQVRFAGPQPGAAAQEPGTGAWSGGALLPEQAAPLYGRPVLDDMARLSEALRPLIPGIVDRFYAQLSATGGVRHLIGCLAPQELAHLKEKQVENITLLCSPHLTGEQHQAVAVRVGQVHAVTGLSREGLVSSIDLLYTLLRGSVDDARHAAGLSILNRRLMKDMGWQLAAAQAITDSRVNALFQISRLCWHASNYHDLITQVAEILVSSEGIAGALFVRRDELDQFRVEAHAGAAMPELVKRLERQVAGWIRDGDSTWKPGPTLEAWRTKTISRCFNFATDPGAANWRPVVEPAGIRSCVAIPLVSPLTHGVSSVLVQYSRLPGGLSSQEQDFFLSQVQSLLVFGINRIEAWERMATPASQATRQRWLGLMAQGGLEMQYQPVMEMSTGRVTRVEALARLRDGEQIVAPAQFLGAFSADDLFSLYVKGLNQSLNQRTAWLSRGIELDIALNLPAGGLEDTRYVEATGRALKEYDCPPGALTLEVLENDQSTSSAGRTMVMDLFKALGVRLAEDDLGSGYSSLARLQEIPFDVIKIDRNIINRFRTEPYNTLRFLYQLTRLGHGLGKQVVVEGVESEDLLQAIARLGPDFVQGNVISRPLRAGDLESWLKSPRSPPGAVQATPGPLSRLTRLLIWEESLNLLGGRTPDSRAKEVALQGMYEFVSALPMDDPRVREARENLVDKAISSGLRSKEFLQAREQMAAILGAETCDLGAGATH